MAPKKKKKLHLLGKKRKAAALEEKTAEQVSDPISRTGGAAAFKAPEASEVLEIAQTRSLYKSNLFRLQLEELLLDARPTTSQPELEVFLRTLQEALEGLAPRSIPPDLASEFPQVHFHLRHPFPISFGPPKRIDLVGGYLLGTCLRSSVRVDVALEMPSEMFQSKDYLNFRYLDKRAAYVAEVHRQLSELRQSGSTLLQDVDLRLEDLHGDAFKPCVLLRPKSSAKWAVRLMPAYSGDLWSVAKLAPNRNALRPLEGASVESFPATAHYNSCVLEDASMRTHLEFLHRSVSRTPGLPDAILLLKKWALAHGFLPKGMTGGAAVVFVPLSGFCLCVLAAHAAQTSNITPAEVSSFQLFKLALGVLSSVDWARQKLVLGSTTPAALSDEERRACQAHFYDRDGYLNFFWRLGPFVADLQWEAKRALRTLDAGADPFDSIFGPSAAPELLWDLGVRTPVLGAGALCPDLVTTALSTEPSDAPEALHLAARLASVLATGLGDRARRTAARLVRKPEGPAVLVGITLDALNQDRIVDKGPSAQDAAECAKFRALWGDEKVEVRRFKDGSILECAVWTKQDPDAEMESSKRPAAVTQLVRHLARRHLPDCEVDVVTGAVGLVPNFANRAKRAWAAFEAFRTHICQLSSLPLAIKDVHVVDAEFSYSELVVPKAPKAESDSIARLLYRAVVEFEGSSRWPDNPEASRKVAAALLLQMREELKQDLGIDAGATEDFLDVRYPEAVFRVQVFHPRELMDVAHRVTNFQAKPTAALPSAEAMERLRSRWWRTRVRAALHGHVLQQPALAGAVRLCKRWLASQLLAGYDDFAEHLAAMAFLQPSPFEVPTSPQVGFCRVCWLLWAFDWQHEPLFVDFDGKLNEEERLSIRQSFEASNKAPSAFWVCSRFDPHALLLRCPPATVSKWLQRRAHQALTVCNKRLLGLSGGSWQALFALDLTTFDVVVKIAPRVGKAVTSRQVSASRDAVAALVSKLQEQFSPVCLVFHGMDDGLVALKWRPGAFTPQPQNALMSAVPHTAVRLGDESLVCVPNVLCLMSVVAALADGLAADVVVVRPQA